MILHVQWIACQSHSIYHDESWVDHFSLGGQVEPDLEEARGVGCVAVDEREHLAVHDTAAGRHPLQVPAAVASCVAHGVRVVDGACDGGRERLKPAMRMLIINRIRLEIIHFK